MRDKFNKYEYNANYRKKHKAQFNIDLNIDEKEELEELLKKYELTKVQLVRNAIDLLKSENAKYITKK